MAAAGWLAGWAWRAGWLGLAGSDAKAHATLLPRTAGSELWPLGTVGARGARRCCRRPLVAPSGGCWSGASAAAAAALRTLRSHPALVAGVAHAVEELGLGALRVHLVVVPPAGCGTGSTGRRRGGGEQAAGGGRARSGAGARARQVRAGWQGATPPQPTNRERHRNPREATIQRVERGRITRAGAPGHTCEGQGHEDGLDAAARLEAKDDAAVVNQVELRGRRKEGRGGEGTGRGESAWLGPQGNLGPQGTVLDRLPGRLGEQVEADAPAQVAGASTRAARRRSPAAPRVRPPRLDGARPASPSEGRVSYHPSRPRRRRRLTSTYRPRRSCCHSFCRGE